MTDINAWKDTLKWFVKIDAARDSDPKPSDTPQLLFDFYSLVPKSKFQKLIASFKTKLFFFAVGILFPILRAICPNPYFGWFRLLIVTRDADVREVLDNRDVFGVIKIHIRFCTFCTQSLYRRRGLFI